MNKVKTKKVFRSGSVIGISVKTPEGIRLGEIQEIVIDIETGRVAYAALCFGGFFRFGDKFFAVPWDEFQLVNDEGEQYFIVDTSREKLKQLQGFRVEEWPDVANSDWDKLIEHSEEESDGKFDEADYSEIERRDEEE